MKKFISLRILAITIIATIGITSCSKNDETNDGVNGNAKVSSYLKSFYSKEFQLGKSVDTKMNKTTSAFSKSVEIESVMITEVFVGDETRARGYIITDKSTNEFLYFLDVDRIDYKLTTVKIDVNDTEVYQNIDELDKYISTNQLDFIKIAEDLVISPDLVASKFWGSSWSQGPCDPETGLAQLFHDYHVIGIRVKHHAELSHGEPMYEPCGMR